MGGALPLDEIGMLDVSLARSPDELHERYVEVWNLGTFEQLVMSDDLLLVVPRRTTYPDELETRSCCDSMLFVLAEFGSTNRGRTVGAIRDLEARAHPPQFRSHCTARMLLDRARGSRR